MKAAAAWSLGQIGGEAQATEGELATAMGNHHLINGISRILKWRHCTI